MGQPLLASLSRQYGIGIGGPVPGAPTPHRRVVTADRLSRTSRSPTGVQLLDYADLQANERAEVERYFRDSVLPLLMPLGFDAARPFPRVASRDIALAVLLRDPCGESGHEHFACVQVPAAIRALVPLHWRRHASLDHAFVWLDDVITEHLPELFAGMEIVEVHPFRIFRDAESSAVLALVVSERMPARLVDLLSRNLRVSATSVPDVREVKDLAQLAELCFFERPNLRLLGASAR